MKKLVHYTEKIKFDYTNISKNTKRNEFFKEATKK